MSVKNSELELDIQSYDDVRSHLISIDKELDVITDYMYMYESHDDTELTESANEVSRLYDEISDRIAELFAIANKGA